MALMGAGGHWTVMRGLNGTRMRVAVRSWMRRSTGWDVEYRKMRYGVCPLRLRLEGVRGSRGDRWEAEAAEIGASLDWESGEVREVWVCGPTVRMRTGTNAEGRPDWRGELRRVARGWGKDFTVGRAWVRGGRFEALDATDKALWSVDGLEIETGALGWAHPLAAEVFCQFGSSTNTLRVEANAGAPAEWAGQWRDWPVRLRAEALVNDLAAARGAFGNPPTGPLERPAAWLNCVGTPGYGVTVDGAFTDGPPFQTPWITIQWKGELHAGADGLPEGELEVAVPLLSRDGESWRNGGGAVRVAGGRAEGRVEAGPWAWEFKTGLRRREAPEEREE